jgi:tetratricopeptide (TPR) repeat protein
MILVPSEVVEALLALRRRDRGARLDAESAAAMHLQRPLRAPVRVATRASVEVTPGAVLRATPPLPPARGDLLVGGLRVPDLELTLAALLARGGAESVGLVAALLRDGSALERRAVDPARWSRACVLFRDPAVTARLGWWLLRLGAPHRPLPGGAVPLCPAGPRDAPRIAAYGLLLNAGDGLPDPDRRAATVLADALARWSHAQSLGAVLACGVALSPETLPPATARVLRRLARCGLLAPEGGLWRPVAPFDGACALLAARCPTPARDALLDALGEGSSPDAAVAVAHALAVRGRASSALRGLLSRAASLPQAAPGALARLLGVLPEDARERLAREAPAVFERLGRWEELARVFAAMVRTSRGAARGSALVRAATVAWKRDRIPEAEALLARAFAHRRTSPGDRFEAALLRATLHAEAGAFAPAAQILAGARARAVLDDDPLREARALHRLGTLDARRGHLRDALAHYDAALARCPPEAQALRGVLRSNSAAIQLWTGRLDAAEALVRAAWTDRAVVGGPAERLGTQVLAARIEGARGVAAPAAGRMLPLAWEAERSGSPRLAAEVWMDAAVELSAAGRHDAAQDAIDRARHTLVQIPGAEPTLRGLLDEAHGVCALARGAVDAARDLLARAVRALERLGVHFYATRARRSFAAAALAAGDEGAARRAMARVLRDCEREELVLTDALTHAPTLCLAALDGDAAARRMAGRALSALDPRAVEQRLRAHPSLARRFLASPATPPVAEVVVDGRARGVDAVELSRLREGHAVVVDLGAVTLAVPGRPVVSLLRRRVLTPLLAALGGAPEGVTADALCVRVWQRRPSASSRTAVKVAVSRLRALLGASGPALIATRLRGAAAYRWDAAHVALVVIAEGPTRTEANPVRRNAMAPMNSLD